MEATALTTEALAGLSPDLGPAVTPPDDRLPEVLLLQPLGRFQPPSADCGDGRCQDLFLHFILIVVLPAAVALVIVLAVLLSLLVACCLRRKRRKNERENEDELATYESIRLASATLRRMSHTSSTPMLSGRSDSLSLPRNGHRRRTHRPPRDSCHSAPGTLQRHHRNRETVSLQDIPREPPPPPPYGIPADYFLTSNDDDDAFWGPDIPLQELQRGFSTAAEEAGSSPAQAGRSPARQEDGQDPSPHSPDHRQRPYSAVNGYTAC